MGERMSLRFGGDYSPDQWPEHVWAQDVALMRQAGVNLVSVGVFSWASLEPLPGKHDFDWLDRSLDLLHRNGIGVALATPTASPPPWFTLAHPEAMPVTEDGVRLRHGSRDTYCLSAPAYRDAALDIAGRLAERYADHPALRLWHVHNEYAATCHCPFVAQRFREWLAARYGDLETFNEAWTTAFWSQRYADWAHVMTPAATQYLRNPAQLVDFRRFLSDELRERFREQRDLLRAANPAVPVTTNYVFGNWVPVDHASWRGDVDVVAVDCYPDGLGVAGARQVAFAGDLARHWAGGRPWLLAEQSPGAVVHEERALPRPPGGMTRASLGFLARGSDGAMFFQWRASAGGAEFFHPGLVPHAGPDSRVFRETVELGGLLGRLAEVEGAEVTADAAILFDAASWWATQTPSLPAPIDYLSAVREAHGALWRAGITADFVGPGDPLSGYRLVLVPSLMLLSGGSAGVLREFVEGGGHLVVGYFSGITDERVRVSPDGYLGGLRDVLGVRIEEHYPLPAGGSVALSTGDSGELWSERVHATGAEVVASYADGPLTGSPAITRNGSAWYVSTRLADPDPFLAGVCTAAGVQATVPGLPAGVEAVRRGGYLFAVNHTGAPARVPAQGVDLVSGAVIDAGLEVAAGGYAVVRVEDPGSSRSGMA
jgi:beta-galactosidase